MKFTRSLFSSKIVNEEMEDIQKALVLAHSHFTSQGKFDDALKISNLLAKNLNKDGNFNLEGKDQLIKKEQERQQLLEVLKTNKISRAKESSQLSSIDDSTKISNDEGDGGITIWEKKLAKLEKK